jgi:sulfoquinovose isomerase
MSWLTTPAHARWLEAEGDRLLDFGRASPAGRSSAGRSSCG